MGIQKTRFHLAGSFAVVISAIIFAGCGNSKIPTISSQASVGAGATPTPIPVPSVPKTVDINWPASHAKDVGVSGGYKVWVHQGSKPTTANTTAIVVANPGGGVHVTTKSVVLNPGRYYISVSSYSLNGDSPLSTPAYLVIP
ncbi:hypothetical protein BH10BDE1_BH10BDE1_08900 [soil metagenome]